MKIKIVHKVIKFHKKKLNNRMKLAHQIGVFAVRKRLNTSTSIEIVMTNDDFLNDTLTLIFYESIDALKP